MPQVLERNGEDMKAREEAKKEEQQEEEEGAVFSDLSSLGPEPSNSHPCGNYIKHKVCFSSKNASGNGSHYTTSSRHTPE